LQSVLCSDRTPSPGGASWPFFSGFPSVPPLCCSFRSQFRHFCRLIGSLSPALHALSFEGTTQGLFQLVAHRVGFGKNKKTIDGIPFCAVRNNFRKTKNSAIILEKILRMAYHCTLSVIHKRVCFFYSIQNHNNKYSNTKNEYIIKCLYRPNECKTLRHMMLERGAHQNLGKKRLRACKFTPCYEFESHLASQTFTSVHVHSLKGVLELTSILKEHQEVLVLFISLVKLFFAFVGFFEFAYIQFTLHTQHSSAHPISFSRVWITHHDV